MKDDFPTRLAVALLLLWQHMMPTSLAHAENIGSIPTIRRWVEDPLSTVPARLNEGAWLALGDIKPDCLQPDVPRQPVSLIMAVDYSLCRSPEIAGTWAAIKAQSAALGQSRAAYLPSLSVTVNRQRTQSKYADSELISTTAKGVSISVGFNWRLFDFGTRAATEESANDLLLAAMADHDATLQQVLATTIQAYFDTQTAQAAWTASKHNMVTAMETLNSAKRREQMGAVSRGDTLQATTAYAKLVLEHSRAGGSFRKSLATLMFNMGLSSGDPVTLVDESDYVPAPGVLDDPMEALVGSLEQYLETARRSHPAIRAAKAQWEAAAAVVRATRGEGLPTVDLAVNTFKNGYPGQGLSASASRVNTVGIAISFPLFDGYAHSYKVKEMSARQDQKDAVLTEVERHILSDIVRTHADVTAALGNLKASKQLSEAAMEALLSAKRKYERGAADIQEILQTQNAVADARQERVRCLSELRSARLRLLTSTGILGLRQMHDER